MILKYLLLKVKESLELHSLTNYDGFNPMNLKTVLSISLRPKSGVN